jgi:hypothetical protein
MKILQSIVIIFSICVVATASVQAQGEADSIQFKGTILDGPFKDQTIGGFCKRDPLGDHYKQKTKCVMKMRGGFKVVDAQARLEVVGGNQALRIILGASMGATDKKGNFKLSAFQATTFYDRDISLFDIPRQFVAVDVSIVGVSVTGPVITTRSCAVVTKHYASRQISRHISTVCWPRKRFGFVRAYANDVPATKDVCAR